MAGVHKHRRRSSRGQATPAYAWVLLAVLAVGAAALSVAAIAHVGGQSFTLGDMGGLFDFFNYRLR